MLCHLTHQLFFFLLCAVALRLSGQSSQFSVLAQRKSVDDGRSSQNELSANALKLYTRFDPMKQTSGVKEKEKIVNKLNIFISFGQMHVHLTDIFGYSTEAKGVFRQIFAHRRRKTAVRYAFLLCKMFYCRQKHTAASVLAIRFIHPYYLFVPKESRNRFDSTQAHTYTYLISGT